MNSISTGVREEFTIKLKRQKYLEFAFVILCGIFYFLWSIHKELGSAPDEIMRYQIPEYIFKFGSLPNGDMAELRNPVWGFSYAYYPTFLGPIFSALFMKIASLFSSEAFILVVAARFTSVLSGACTIWFVLKICDRIFSTRVKWIVAIMIASIPQFAFLSSYVNNDTLAVCGSAIICYAWICGLQDGWNYKNGLILAAGITVEALSYYNSYGWILCSIAIFVGSYVLKLKKNRNYGNMFKVGIVLSVVVLLFISGFFIRNAVLYNGDFLGMDSLTASSQMYAEDFLKPTNRDIAVNKGQSVWDMLTEPKVRGESWLELSYKSFISVLGQMDCFVPGVIYKFYFILLAIGGMGFIGETISSYFGKNRLSSEKIKGSLLLKGCLAVALFIPIILSIYYSYAVDYQAQGRYCYPMIVALMVFWGIGVEWIMKKIPGKLLKNVLTTLICIILVIIVLYAYALYN